MTTTKMSHAEALKAELMERYGLKEDQVTISVNIYTTDTELGSKILSENDMYSTKQEYLKDDSVCDCSFGEHINSLWVYKRNSKDEGTANNE